MENIQGWNRMRFLVKRAGPRRPGSPVGASAKNESQYENRTLGKVGEKEGIPLRQQMKHSHVEHKSVASGQDLTLTLVACGCIFGFLMMAFIAFVIVKKKRRNTKLIRGDLSLEDMSGFIIKQTPEGSDGNRRWSTVSPPSAPSSRRGTLARSITIEDIPDFSLPPERIQPLLPGEKCSSKNSLQYQQSFLGSVQPDLYRYSEDEDDSNAPPSICGRLWFSILYDWTTEQLHIHVIKAKHLSGRGRHNNSRDPFVKLYLLPDEKTGQQTKPKRKTLSPKWNESFMFQAPADDIINKTLRMSVYDVDRRRVRHSLGHVLVYMKDLDLTKCDQEAIWRDLEPVAQTSSMLGDINFSLTYIPNSEKLRVVILRAKNLTKVDYEHSGLYVKVQFFFGRKVYKSKKTQTIKGTGDPVYNESFNFQIGSRHLDSFNFHITMVCNSSSKLGRDHEYGKVVVGPFMFSRGEELMHWQEMIAKPRSAIAKWHSLAPL